MNERLSRRRLLKKSAAVAGIAAGSRVFGVPALLADPAPNSKLGFAVIGCGGRSGAHLPVAAAERLVAVADPDEGRTAGSLKSLTDSAEKLQVPRIDVGRVRQYYDYRKMFDELHRQIDAVFVVTVDHHHALASIAAIKLGKHVFCEKPLTHDVYEARVLSEAARKHKVATQMGNQGHAFESLRRLAEYLQAGAIGNVLETHSWQGWVYGTRKRLPTEPVPPGLHWDEWLGPAPFRPYQKEIHPSPGWLQWCDFGASMLGGMGHHVLDPVYFCLKLGFPTSVEALEQIGGSAEAWPTLSTLRYDFPARGSMPPVKVYWYDGVKPGGDPNLIGYRVQPEFLNRPALADEIEKKHGRQFPDGGTLFVGEKGIMHCGPYSEGPRIIPEAKHKEFPAPPKTLPRTKDIHQDFLAAIRGGPAPCSNFADYAGPFTEMMYVGFLAMKAGVGKKVEWDGPNMRCTNMPELNQWARRERRKGWEL